MHHADKIGPVTLRVAQWAAGLKFRDIPENVIAYAKLLLLDGIGCTVFGSQRQAGRSLFEFVAGSGNEKPEATIWGHGRKVGPRAAGLVNGTAAHTTNIGDTHRATIFHTNYITPQAAIAVAEKERKRGRDVITAIIAGNEVGTRAGIAVHIALEGGYFTPESRGWHSTGTIGALAAAVSASRVLGLNADKMVQALVMGGAQLTGIYRPCGPYMGKHWYAGKAVANGIESAYLARSGFVAGYRLFEDGLCYGSGIISPVHELEEASKRLGTTWETLNVDMAIYPAKKTYYPNLDAVLHIIKSEKIKFKDVHKIVVHSAFMTSHAFGTFYEPRNATEAFNSLRHAIAAAVHDGEYGFAQLEKKKFTDPEILAFAKERIEIIRAPELEKLLPEKWPGAADVFTRDGRHFFKRFDYHIGQVQNPIPKDQVGNKFRQMASMVGDKNADTIIDIIDDIERLDDISRLTRLFRPMKAKTTL
jgi:aconitate decarboxylase